MEVPKQDCVEEATLGGVGGVLSECVGVGVHVCVCVRMAWVQLRSRLVRCGRGDPSACHMRASALFECRGRAPVANSSLPLRTGCTKNSVRGEPWLYQKLSKGWRIPPSLTSPYLRSEQSVELIRQRVSSGAGGAHRARYSAWCCIGDVSRASPLTVATAVPRLGLS